MEVMLAETIAAEVAPALSATEAPFSRTAGTVEPGFPPAPAAEPVEPDLGSLPEPASGALQVEAPPREEDAGPPPFGSANPQERARRLARALVSDIVAYHGDRRDRGLREGRVRQELGPEIRRSWETYTAQVGNQIARETSYFRDALNEILANGERLF